MESIYYDANKIYEAGTKAIKSAPFKYSSQLYEMNHLLNTALLVKSFKENKYKPLKGKKFTINERGKTRQITSNSMNDKVVNHLMCDNILSPTLGKYLIHDNSSSQKNKGVSFHRKRLEKHLHQYYRHYKSNVGYVLLVDFSNYYGTIPHKECLTCINNKLESINFKDREITTHILSDLMKIFDTDVGNGIGIDIGSQPSQNIGITYPYLIDNYIKIVKGCKYYGRYTDDIYVIHKDKTFLQSLLVQISDISKQIGLKINTKKTRIVKLSDSFQILKTYYSLTDTGRIIKKINKKAIVRARRRLKGYKRLLDNKKLLMIEIEHLFKSWIVNNYKVMSKIQIQNMFKLYYDLFEEVPKWKKHSKLHYLMVKSF